MTDENESGPPEDASHAKAQRAYERRIAIDQYKGQLEQGVQIRKELEEAHSAHGEETQAEKPGPIAAVLEQLSGSNAADLSDLSESAAARHLALKSELTSERETALRDLETGKGSTLATAKVFRSVPHLLDTLPGVPLIQKVRSLVQRLNAPQEWDGYLDPHWTTGQTVLWIATGDSWTVDQASNKSGNLGEDWGQITAADLIDNLNLPRQPVEDAADKLWQRCFDGRMRAFDGEDNPIPTIRWRHLKVVLDGGNMLYIVYRKHRRQSPAVPAYSNVVFERIEVLREFPPAEPSEDQDMTAPSVPPEVETIENLLPTRNANWAAPTKLEMVGWTPTTSSAAPVQFNAQAERRSEALRSLHPADASAQFVIRASEPQQVADGATDKTDTTKRAVSLTTYSTYQRATKSSTGYFASQAAEERWAKKDGYSVESVRAARVQFREGLLPAERTEFEKKGRRPAKKPA